MAPPPTINTLLDQMERVEITSLKTFPGNPRVGDQDAIAASLATNGMFSPLVVQRSTNYVLAGNHTLKAARDKLSWTHIDVVYVDVDNARAKRIVAAANRTADLGTYNEYLQAELLQDIADSDLGLEGTGYDESYLDDLLTRIDPEEEDGIELEEQPTEAAYAEDEKTQTERAERVAGTQSLAVQGLSEIVIVLPLDDKADLLDELEALRERLGDKPNGPLIHQAVRIATIICDQAHVNAPPMDFSKILELADPGDDTSDDTDDA